MLEQRDNTQLRTFARNVILRESAAVAQTANLLDEQFDNAIHLLKNCTGNVIVSGVGKSGIIGKKISATLASTGTPSHFMHATEAMHGDLGRVCTRDIALLLSYSGATEEIVSLAAILHQDSIPIIGLSQSKSSRLGTLSTASLAVGDVEEACQHNLAPTASTAAMLALGDALALTVSRERSFSAADFHKRHPGGLIGKKLLPITKILRFEVGRNVALAPYSATLRAALEKAELIGRRSGALLIIDAERRLAGILTDSDLRRLLVAHGMQIMESRLESIMTHEPRFLMETDLVQDAIKLVEEIRVDEIPVVDISGFPIGIVDVQDLISLKLMNN